MKALKAKQRGRTGEIVAGKIHKKDIPVSETERWNKNEREILYPDSDGKPMAENTKQFDWIVKIKEGLEILFADTPDVFVAGDLFWYPVKGNNKIRTAPDVMVAFGRPKGYRGSYRQWEEDNVAPQVVFEILSPGNTPKEMKEKCLWYERYGVEEYYLYDPDGIELDGWIRSGKRLQPVKEMQGQISPRLNIRFELGSDDLTLFRPDGQTFLSPLEMARQAEDKIRHAELKAEQEKKRAELLEAKLKSLGISENGWSI